MKRMPLRTPVACIIAFGVVFVLCLASQTQGSSSKGTVKVGAEDTGMEIELTDRRVVTIPANGAASLPAGTFSVKSFTLVAKQAGKVWKIKCTRPYGKMESLTVTAGETTTLDVGPPFFLRASAQQLPPQNGRAVGIGLVIQGKSQESYSPAVTVGSQQVPPPKFKIVDDNGKTLAAGQLEYG